MQRRNMKRGVKRYYDDENELSIQQKIFKEKNKDNFIEKQNDYRNKRNTNYTELHRSYVE